MAQRMTAVCDGRYIGIETIYTVIEGRQVNIPDRVKELREKSRNHELFCPCGCGANLILVAGDKNLREQHFRIKDGAYHPECLAVAEGRTSIDSKIVLKCWLDDKLAAADLESRIPIHAVDNVGRKYEFTFLSKEKKTALSYCYERANLSDEKISILEDNSVGLHIIYVVDSANGGCNGQYPENLMKVQARQGFCLLLSIHQTDYEKAMLEAVFYAQDADGLWQENSFASGLLKDFDIDADGSVVYAGQSLEKMLGKAKALFFSEYEKEIKRRDAEEKEKAAAIRKQREEQERLEEERKKIWRELQQRRMLEEEEIARRRAEFQEKKRLEEERRTEERRRWAEDFARNMASQFSQQETQVRDADGNRWIKCEFCGRIARDGEFSSYGGIGRMNLGTCKECYEHNPVVKEKAAERDREIRKKYDMTICPECGGKLRERSGPYGKFLGCDNYPACKYTRRK